MKTTMKTSELTGAALDWAVAKCEGKAVRCVEGRIYYGRNEYEGTARFNPSTNWAQGGPIIEREKISVSAWGLVNWKALTLRYPQDVEEEFTAFGETPLIAAMRCYVASKLGNEVEIPEELRC